MKFWYEYDTNEYSWRNIFEYIRISEYLSHCHSVTNMKFWYKYDTNEYSWRKIFEYIRISEYSSHCHSVTNMKFWYEYDTNEYSWRKIFEYIWISEYSSHYDTYASLDITPFSDPFGCCFVLTFIFCVCGQWLPCLVSLSMPRVMSLSLVLFGANTASNRQYHNMLPKLPSKFCLQIRIFDRKWSLESAGIKS